MTHHSRNGRWRIGRVSRGLGSTGGIALALTLGLAAVTPSLARAQNGTVSGRVTASGGGPIANAQVTVQGTALGIATGADGTFTLLVPAGQRTIRVLAIGYKVGTLQVTVPPNGTATANLELTRSVLNLDEVVVTGTGGEATRRELGNSITAINVSANVKDVPTNVDQLLQARTAGLTVMQSGAAAGSGAQIRLRGVVSVNQSNQPIVYIDGIRVRSEGYERAAPPEGADFTGRGTNMQSSPLDDINPDDIDHIEIIKGAAAATLYGTEASAGVIQIFTKKGTRGAKPRWNVEIDEGMAQSRPFGTPWNPYLNLKPKDSITVTSPTGNLADAQVNIINTNPSQGLCYPNGSNDSTAYQTVAGLSAPVDVVHLPPLDASGNTLPCSWLRNGWRQRYNASVTGGFEQFQYFASGGYENNNGVLPQDNETKLVTRGNFSFDVSDKVRLEWNTSYNHTDIRNTPSGNNAQGLILNVYRAERNYRNSSNPLVIDSLLHQSIKTTLDHLVTGGSVYYTPFPWFSNRLTVGYDLASQENRAVRPFGFVGVPKGRMYTQEYRFTTLTLDYAGNMDYRLTGNLAGTFTVGGQSVTNQRAGTNAFGSDFAGPGDPVVNSAARFVTSEDRLRVVNAGFFFQNTFKLKDRYFLTGGLRIDGNSAFGKSLGLQAYPKVSMSYVLSDEPWFPQSIGEIKLRGSLGYAGRAPGAFDALRTWSPLPSAGLPGFEPNNVGDTLVGPERTRELELGADLGVLNHRLALEFTYYTRTTTDALFNVRQIPSLGFLNSQSANVGKLGSDGIELTANATLVDKAKFGFDLGASIFTNRGRILDLGGATAFSANGGWVQGPDTLANGTVQYFPIAGGDGILIHNKDAIAAPDTTCDPARGDLCAITGLQVLGPQQPTLILGGNFNLRLPGNVTLSARGELQKGAYIFDAASDNALQRSVRWPTCDRANGILDQGGTATDLTAWERIACIASNHSTYIHWQKQDFFKLRDLTLTVPVTKLFQGQVQSASLRVSVQNYFHWYNSDLKLFDPEMNGRDSITDQSRVMNEDVPPPATMTMSLRLTF